MSWKYYNIFYISSKSSNLYPNNASHLHSLLSFDVVEADKPISEELKQEKEKDGVIIYEKA